MCNKIILKLITSGNIAYHTLLFMCAAFIYALCIDDLFERLFGSDIENKSDEELVSEIFLQVAWSGIAFYWAKNLVNSISSPFVGMCDYQENKIEETNSASLLLMFLIIMQKNLNLKIQEFRNRIQY